MARMPLERFAREAGVPPATARYYARRGMLERAADGTVDPAQAREWQADLEARRGRRAEVVESDSRLLQARLAATLAKTQLARLKLNETAASVIDKAEAVEAASAEIVEALTRLKTIDPAPLLASGLSAGQARDLLSEFLSLLLADLGDPAAELRG